MHLLALITILLVTLIIDFYLTIYKKRAEAIRPSLLYLLITSLMIQSANNDSLISVITYQKFFVFLTFSLLISLLLFYRSLFSPLLSRFFYVLTTLIVTLAFFLKQLILNQPLVWNDIKNGLVVDVLWNMVIKAHYLLATLALILILLIVWLTLKERQSTTWVTRFIYGLFATFILFFSLSMEKKALAAINKLPTDSSDQLLQKIEGPVLYFLNSKNTEIMPMPEGYSKKNMLGLVKELSQTYSQVKPTATKDKTSIVYILSEAFADPTMFENSQWIADPMPNIRKLQTEAGGQMLVNNFGSGTANTEFSIVTNFSYSLFQANTTPYNYLFELPEKDWPKNTSVVPGLNKQGYTTTAMHTHLKKGYHREDVFKKFEFDQALFREDMNLNRTKIFYYDESFLSDRTLFSYITDQLKSSDQPQFIHALSMQNHFPYSNKEPVNEKTNLLKNLDTLPGGDELAIFARGIQKTDRSIKELLSQIKELDQEVNVVFYGDHLPALTKTLYNNSSLTNYSDQTVAKFATPYFIWNNQGKKLTSPSLVNPEFLTASVLEQSNLDLSVFQRLTADLSHSIEAFKTAGPAYYKNNQEITLTPSEQNMLKAYQLLQYDHLFGYDYAKELFE